MRKRRRTSTEERKAARPGNERGRYATVHSVPVQEHHKKFVIFIANVPTRRM